MGVSSSVGRMVISTAVVSRTDPAEGDVLSVADFALPLQDTALANVQSESSTLWYAARRLNEGMDADTAAALHGSMTKTILCIKLLLTMLMCSNIVKNH